MEEIFGAKRVNKNSDYKAAKKFDLLILCQTLYIT